jgi:predicted GIY-YIG superfamily endonuclease
MPIDNCVYTFEELTASVLPKHFKLLEAAIQSPIAAETFVGFKSVTKEILSRLNRSTDFPGCYVFIDRDKPIYVGISRGVIKRLVQHLNFDSHYSASLVYRMASEDYPHEMKRDQAMKDEQFKAVFFSAQERLRQMKAAFVEINNDLELYLFEVFASMKMDTDTWNTFRTH